MMGMGMPYFDGDESDMDYLHPDHAYHAAAGLTSAHDGTGALGASTTTPKPSGSTKGRSRSKYKGPPPGNNANNNNANTGGVGNSPGDGTAVAPTTGGSRRRPAGMCCDYNCIVKSCVKE